MRQREPHLAIAVRLVQRSGILEYDRGSDP
jgi:hypothetical protein